MKTGSVLNQGNTLVNGPHQGAWVDTPTGGEKLVFAFFRTGVPFGRVVHLEPMTWRDDDWPVIGLDPKNTGIGSPALTYTKPKSGYDGPTLVLPTSDDFAAHEIGFQWQWQCNPKPDWATFPGSPAHLLLKSIPSEIRGLRNSGNLLLQKIPGPAFMATTSLEFSGGSTDDVAGLIVFGHDFAWIGSRCTAKGYQISYSEDWGSPDPHVEGIDLAEAVASKIYLRVVVSAEGVASLSWSRDNSTFTMVGTPFPLSPGRWVGAKVGLFATAMDPDPANPGHADFSWFRVQPVLP